MPLAALFLPAAASPLVLVLSGLMLTIGLRKLAGRLAALAILVPMFPIFEPMFDAVLDALPFWLSWLVPASIAPFTSLPGAARLGLLVCGRMCPAVRAVSVR